MSSDKNLTLCTHFSLGRISSSSTHEQSFCCQRESIRHHPVHLESHHPSTTLAQSLVTWFSSYRLLGISWRPWKPDFVQRLTLIGTLQTKHMVLGLKGIFAPFIDVPLCIGSFGCTGVEQDNRGTAHTLSCVLFLIVSLFYSLYWMLTQESTKVIGSSPYLDRRKQRWPQVCVSLQCWQVWPSEHRFHLSTQEVGEHWSILNLQLERDLSCMACNLSLSFSPGVETPICLLHIGCPDWFNRLCSKHLVALLCSTWLRYYCFVVNLLPTLLP